MQIKVKKKKKRKKKRQLRADKVTGLGIFKTSE